ncbi:MAG TPA: Spy/CpxP family protein refolding chaperone [Alphaproteobacteria bacterium]|nr:Spy/CpxP family protein refolding chaperone [Alphaproteobacteria bacterium]
MLKISRAAALATVLGAIALASPAFAAPVDNTSPAGPPTSTVTIDNSGHVVNSTQDTSDGYAPAAPAAAPMHHHHMMQNAQAAPSGQPAQATKVAAGPGDMREHVEERIKTLHDKLGITKDQEPQWTDVAQAMRDSEANVVSLIQERHQNRTTMNAIDDMDSYQKIAQAHADGLKNVNASFASLYGNFTDQQKQNADKVFGSYEGMGPAHHHAKKSATAPAKK